MNLTEELLIEWTGFKGEELSIFYLNYKKHSSTALLHTDLEYIKQDILTFKYIYDKSKNKDKDKSENVKSLVTFWESKITS
jgi:hypothetical protein